MSKSPQFPQLERLSDRIEVDDRAKPVRYWNTSFGRRWKNVNRDEVVPLDEIYKDEE